MSKKKNIKIFITSLTLCLSTLSLYSASAMKFKQIEINTPKEDKRETVELSKTNIKIYKKTIIGYINKINNDCCKEYGIKYIKEKFKENYEILKNQLNCLENNKIDTDKLVLQLEKFKILKIDPNKKYKFPDEETENNLIEFLDYINNFIEEKKEELSDYLNNKNNEKQIEITKDVVKLYINGIKNAKKQFYEKKDPVFIQVILYTTSVISNGKFDFEFFILNLSKIPYSNINDENPNLYYLKPETKEYLENLINKEKDFLNEQNDYCYLTKDIVLNYIEEMNSSLHSLIDKYMTSIQSNHINIKELKKLKDNVKAFFCFDDEKFNYDTFINNLENPNYLKNKNKENVFIFENVMKILKSNVNKAKSILENIDLQIENMSKTIKNDTRKKKYEIMELVKKLINLYLNKFLKNKIDFYKSTTDAFLNYYETNEIINEDLKNILNNQKNELLKYVRLNNKKKLDKEKFLQNLKYNAKSIDKQNDLNEVDIKIPEYYVEKLEKNFSEIKKNIDDFDKEFQKKYNKITEEIKNKKNIDNENFEELTQKMISKFEEKFKNEIIQFFDTLQQKANNKSSNINFKDNEELQNYININKIKFFNNLCLTKNKKLNEKKFIKILKKYDIIDNLNYKINEKDISNLTSYHINVLESELNNQFNKLNINKNKININPEDKLTELTIPRIVLTKDSFNKVLDDISKVIDNFKNATSEYLKDKENYQKLCESYIMLKENKFIKIGKEINIKNFLENFNIGYNEKKECFINNNPNNLKIDCDNNYIKTIKKRIDENNGKLKNCFEKLEKNDINFFEIETNKNIKLLLSSLKNNFEYFSDKIKQLTNNYRKHKISGKGFKDLASRYFMLLNLISLTPNEKLDEKNLLEILNFYDSKIFSNKTLKISKEQKTKLENTFKKYRNSSNKLLNMLYYTYRKDKEKIDIIKGIMKGIEKTKELKNYSKKNNFLNKFEIIEKTIIDYKLTISVLHRTMDEMIKFNKNLTDEYKNLYDYIYDIEELICLDENEKLDFEKFKNILQYLNLIDINPNIEYTLSEKLKDDLEKYSKDIKNTIEKNKKLDIKNKNIITKKMITNFLSIAKNLGEKIAEKNRQYKINNKHNKKDLLEQKKILDELKTFFCLTEKAEINYIMLTDKLRKMGYFEIDENKPYCQFENQEYEKYLMNGLLNILKDYEEKNILKYCDKLDELENINNNAPEPNFNINIIPSTKIDGIFDLNNLELYKTFSKKIDNFCNIIINKKNDKKNNNIIYKEKLKDIINDYIKIYKLTFLKDKEKLNENAIEEIDKVIKEDLKINDLEIINSNIAKQYKIILEHNINNFKKIINEKIEKLCEKNKYNARYIKDQIKCKIENLEKEFLNNENEIENKIILNNKNNNSINIKNEDLKDGNFINENYINNENEEDINKIIFGDAAPILPTNNININQNEINNKNEIKNNLISNIDIAKINKPVDKTEELKNNFDELQTRFKDIVENFNSFVNDYVNLKDSLIKSNLTDILNKDNISKFNSIYNNFLNENKIITKKQNEKKTLKEQEEKRKEKEEKNKKKNNK